MTTTIVKRITEKEHKTEVEKSLLNGLNFVYEPMEGKSAINWDSLTPEIPEIYLEDHITESDVKKFEDEFEIVFESIVLEFNLKSLFRKIRLKNIINSFSDMLHVPKKWRILLTKDNDKIKEIIQEIILRIRKLDNASLDKTHGLFENSIEEAMQLSTHHISVETLRDCLRPFKTYKKNCCNKCGKKLDE